MLTATMQNLINGVEAYVLCREPLVIAIWERSLENAECFQALRDQAAATPDLRLVVQVGFSPLSAEELRPVADGRDRLLAEHPGVRIVVMTNNDVDTGYFRSLGFDARLCHQNAFLDERRFRAWTGTRRFDAVYAARLTPFKRHELLTACDTSRLLLLGSRSWKPEEAEYMRTMTERLPGAVQVPFYNGLSISRWFAGAACGLALSAREGAMFASAEYLLCGLPVVNTPSIGGREVMFPPDFVRNVESTPEAVAEGVRHWCDHPVDRRGVREAFLALARPHRERLREILAELGVPGARSFRIPHKLGLRTPRNLTRFAPLVRGYLALERFRLK